jgi:long-chain acyl-CoA synthetase
MRPVMKKETTVSNIYSAFTQVATQHPQTSAILYKSDQQWQSISYQELHQRCRKFAQYLTNQCHFNPGDKVGLMLGNQSQFAEHFLGTIAASGVIVALDVQYSSRQVHDVLVHASAQYLVTSDEHYQRVRDELPEHIQVILCDDKDTLQKVSNEKDEDVSISSPTTNGSLAVLFYTSGTTEDPKGVMLSHSNLLSNIRDIETVKIVKHQDVVISMLPLHHAYALTTTLLTPLLVGATIAYPAEINSVELLSTMRDTQANIFVGVPQVFSLIYRSVNDKLAKVKGAKKLIIRVVGGVFYLLRKYTNVNLSRYLFAEMHKTFGQSLRYMVSGGAKLDKEVGLGFYRWGFTILEGYGLTETSPVASFNPPSKFKIGSVGVPLPQVRIDIREPNEEGIGEVVIKGPNVMQGYYQAEEKTREVIRDGWFYSGDLGYIDKEGYVFLTGRKKEMIVLSSGKNIYPEEVEHAYMKSPYIKEVGVLQVKGSGMLDKVDQLAAVIVPHEDYFKVKNEGNLRDRLTYEIDTISAGLPTYKAIKGFVVSPEPLPRTRLGKLMRYKLWAIYEELHQEQCPDERAVSEDAPGPGEQAGAESALVQEALHYLEETLNKKVHMSDHLELNLGLDSLGRIEILLGLQAKLNLDLDDDASMAFYMSNTVQELADKLEAMVKDGTAGQGRNSPDGVHQQEPWSMLLKQELPQEVKANIKFEQNIFARAFALMMVLFVKLLFKLFFRLKVRGRENISADRPFIICPNHSSYLDAVAVIAALPIKTLFHTYFLGLKEVLDEILLGPFFKVLHIIPIERNYALVDSLKLCAYVVRNQRLLCFFPEGERSVDGEVKEFKKGIGILMREMSTAAMPTYIAGSFEAWPRYRKWPRCSPIQVTFGRLIRPDDIQTSTDESREAYDVIAQHLRLAVLALAEADQQESE